MRAVHRAHRHCCGRRMPESRTGAPQPGPRWTAASACGKAHGKVRRARDQILRVRMSALEMDELTRLADGRPLSAYVRSKVLG